MGQSMWVIEVSIGQTDEGDNPVWKELHPTHGKPYTFRTQGEAGKVLALCYPGEPLHGADAKVRIKQVM